MRSIRLWSCALFLFGAVSPARAVVSGTWNQLPPPIKRSQHTMVYDSQRNRVIVLGGYSTVAVPADAWEISLGASHAWSRIATVGSSPPAFGQHSAIYDPVRDQMVVFGFTDQPTQHNEVWTLSFAGTPTWTQLAPSGTPPSTRIEQAAVYDPVRERMLVIGGDASGFQQGDVWALSLSGTPAWTQLVASGSLLPGRSGHSAIYDSARDRVIVFGGFNNNALSDVWALPLGAGTPTWSQLSPSGTVPARENHVAVYDPTGDRMVVFGGDTSPGGLLYGDLWVLKLSRPAWSQPRTSGAPPDVRTETAAAYDGVGDRLVLFGGRSSATGVYFNDTWSLSLGKKIAWSLFEPATPIAERFGAGAIYDPPRDRMVVFGGSINNPNLGGPGQSGPWGFAMATGAWTSITTSGTPPSDRSGLSAIYDPVRNRMLVFGGQSSVGYLNDTWSLSFASNPPAWSQLNPSGSLPPGRAGHSAVYDPVRDQMIVFGGQAPSGQLNDTWALSLAGSLQWTQIGASGADPLNGYAIYDPVRDRLLAFAFKDSIGSFGQHFMSNQVWELPLAGTPVWNQLVTNGTVSPPRSPAGLLYDPVRDRMLVFAGSAGRFAQFNDIWELALPTLTWTQLSPAGPLPRVQAAATLVYDPVRDRMLDFSGGGIVAGFTNDIWELAWGFGSVAAAPMSRAAASPGDPLVAAMIPGPARAQMTLRGFVPNPSGAVPTVSFSLPGSERATLEVFDIAGRRLLAQHIEDASPGVRTVRLSGLQLAPGIYVIRLTQGNQELHARACVVR